MALDVAGLGQVAELGRELFPGRSRLQPHHNPAVVSAALAGSCRPQRSEEIRSARNDRFAGKHPDDSVRLALQMDGFPDDSRVGMEGRLPQGVAEHHCLRAIRMVFCLGEGAAEIQWNPEHLEVARRNAALMHVADSIACRSAGLQVHAS